MTKAILKSSAFLFSLLLNLPIALVQAHVISNENNLTKNNRALNFSIPQKMIFDKDRVELDAPIGDGILQSPILTAFINGQGPFHLMFDTGFAQSLISLSLAKSLKLPIMTSKTALHETPNQLVKVIEDHYLVEDLKIGDIELRDYFFVVSSGFEDDIKDLKELHVDGVLSANAFYPLVFTIDYKQEKIFLEKKSLEKSMPNVISYAKSSSVPNLKATLTFSKLKREMTQDMIVDTGCGYYIFVNSCEVPEMTLFRGKQNLTHYDYTGMEETKYFAQLYGDIKISPDHVLKSPYITFGSVHCDSGNPKGLLGRKFFEQYTVTIDPVNELIQIN